MKVITLLNEKGGVGKTTLATHIAAGLAEKGLRVVLVDTDAQGSAGIVLGVDPQPGLYELLVRKTGWDKLLHHIPSERYTNNTKSGFLFVLPSNAETAAIPLAMKDPLRLMVRLEELKSHADVVIIDTPPTPSLIHGSAYIATDYILYPTQMHYLSLYGMQQSMGRLDDVKMHRQQFGRPPIKVLGLVPTMYRGNTVEQSENLQGMEQKWGSDLVWQPIGNRTIYTEASSYQQPVWMIEEKSSASDEMRRVVNRTAMEIGYVQA